MGANWRYGAGVWSGVGFAPVTYKPIMISNSIFRLAKTATAMTAIWCGSRNAGVGAHHEAVHREHARRPSFFG